MVAKGKPRPPQVWPAAGAVHKSSEFWPPPRLASLEVLALQGPFNLSLALRGLQLPQVLSSDLG